MSNVVKLAEAKEVLADESAKQPTVDQTAQKLQKALDNLRPNSQIQMEIQIWETCQDRTLKQKLGL